MSASLPVRSLLAATAAMLLLSACSTAYYTGDTISGPAQRMKRDADGNLHDPLLDAPNRSLMTCMFEAPVTVLQRVGEVPFACPDLGVSATLERLRDAGWRIRGSASARTLKATPTWASPSPFRSASSSDAPRPAQALRDFLHLRHRHEPIERRTARQISTDHEGPGLDAWIGRIVDPHLSEYVPEHWQSVAWLTGFTGSTARLCVTQGAAALLVDSRYWEQAEGELDGAPFEVVRLGAPYAPSQEAWLSQGSPTRGRVGRPELWSESDVRRIRTSLADCGLELALVPDLFDDVWTQGRPARPQTAVTPMTQDSSTVADRLARVREVLRDRASEALCLHSLDDIAWLTGCRAADIKFNPVFLASMIVTDSEALLYTEASRFTP